MADPDRAGGTSIHNPENGQRNGRRELTRCFLVMQQHPAQGSYRGTLQVAEVGATAQRELGKPRASHPFRPLGRSCSKSVFIRALALSSEGGPTCGAERVSAANAWGGGAGEGSTGGSMKTKISNKEKKMIQQLTEALSQQGITDVTSWIDEQRRAIGKAKK